MFEDIAVLNSSRLLLIKSLPTWKHFFQVYTLLPHTVFCISALTSVDYQPSKYKILTGDVANMFIEASSDDTIQDHGVAVRISHTLSLVFPMARNTKNLKH